MLHVPSKMEIVLSTLATLLFGLTSYQAQLTHAESKMRTLYFGLVPPPPGPGEIFHKRLWLKSVLPNLEGRCWGGDDQKVTSVDGVTEACVTFTTESYQEEEPFRYPTQGLFNSSLKQLEFSVRTPASIGIYVYGDSLEKLYYIVFSSDGVQMIQFGTFDHVSLTDAGVGTEGGFGRFWLAVVNNASEMHIGKSGNDAPLLRMNHTTSSLDILRLEILGDAGRAVEVQIYMPCY
ncbi:uncharacterized protein LOC110980337 [Acanthaster planci]|uniref:Uncharacterized protein LOC110980337 n=1 Tax=Acanthaster planci TaxID=133434 RepID=A0A8B7YJN6_ACAPL|nr:uncharacterized protein LOC110980337 [Acanthaster planci]